MVRGMLRSQVGRAAARGLAGADAAYEVPALDRQRLGQVQVRDVDVALADGEELAELGELGRAVEAFVVDAQLLGRVGVVELDHAGGVLRALVGGEGVAEVLVLEGADGVVVGSALVEAVRTSLDADGKATDKTVTAVTSIVSGLAGAVRGVKK